MSLRRPVAWTAWTNSRSSHELTVVRSSGLSSESRPASSGSVGPWPEATLTVECCYPEGSVILTQLGAIGNLSAALEH